MYAQLTQFYRLPEYLKQILAVEKPVREWDLGKKADTRRGRETERDDKEHLRENLRGANNLDRDFDRDRGERSDRNERNERPGERGDRRRRSLEKRRHSESTSPGLIKSFRTQAPEQR